MTVGVGLLRTFREEVFFYGLTKPVDVLGNGSILFILFRKSNMPTVTRIYCCPLCHESSAFLATHTNATFNIPGVVIGFFIDFVRIC
jgi:hypothetical protein